MEDTIQYLDNILRNPNRFIVNEEDIVKIELARRVTVESIKHLSKNTNLIQDYNKETGDVRPSKILNINKEESFDTYENRFIYSLIKNMKFYIDRKNRNLITESSSKDDTKMEYNAKSSIGRENVDISMTIKSKKEEKKSNKNDDGMSIEERIEKLELQISDLCSSSVYQTIDKMHISLVTSPINNLGLMKSTCPISNSVSLLVLFALFVPVPEPEPVVLSVAMLQQLYVWSPPYVFMFPPVSVFVPVFCELNRTSGDRVTSIRMLLLSPLVCTIACVLGISTLYIHSGSYASASIYSL